MRRGDARVHRRPWTPPARLAVGAPVKNGTAEGPKGGG